MTFKHGKAELVGIVDLGDENESISKIQNGVYKHIIILLYNMDASVLRGNIPLVKLIRNYIRCLSGVFSISSLVKISMTSLGAFSVSS